MRSSLSTVGRRAGVLTAAVLVTLCTAACDPAAVRLDAAGATDAGEVSSQAVTEQPAPDGPAGATVPVPVPSGTPAGTQPHTQPQVQPQVPEDLPEQPGVPESPAGGSTGAAAAGRSASAPVPVPVQAAPTVPERPAVEDRGHRKRDRSAPAAGSAAAAGPGARSSGSPASGSEASGSVASGSGAGTAATQDGTSSSGAGGTYTNQGRRTHSAAGHTGAYLRYAAGVDPARPVGLVVYVDGTGEFGIDNPDSAYALGGSSGLVATSRARNMVTLAVASPNRSCKCWHEGDTAGYADFLAALVEEHLAAYPVSEVWLAGFSSGAQEITRFLVPRHPELMRLGGGWVVFGGGGPPAGSASAVTAASMAGVRGHWFTGTADTAVPLTATYGAQAGERWYAARGVATSRDFPQGVGHALDGRLGSTVGRLIDAS
ncbi:hypothetical protein [Geodermatophilus sp. DSM 44513]|uniref:hypothetical protein n=1 Tax=Geodermatophilus sp. DSM 44513 TaxID=1528104 RepID=UPI0012789520|nr:hypothetical protein [Geodermatophilus sp. DSM 44513]WNV76041.1 hypothetical protein RTG05_01900 [Geodermatophilus sp. DSM 44513]